MSPRELYQRFEDHFMKCRECRLTLLCGDGKRLKTEYEFAAASRDRTGPPLARPRLRRQPKR